MFSIRNDLLLLQDTFLEGVTHLLLFLVQLSLEAIGLHL